MNWWNIKIYEASLIINFGDAKIFFESLFIDHSASHKYSDFVAEKSQLKKRICKFHESKRPFGAFLLLFCFAFVFVFFSLSFPTLYHFFHFYLEIEVINIQRFRVAKYKWVYIFLFSFFSSCFFRYLCQYFFRLHNLIWSCSDQVQLSLMREQQRQRLGSFEFTLLLIGSNWFCHIMWLILFKDIVRKRTNERIIKKIQCTKI